MWSASPAVPMGSSCHLPINAPSFGVLALFSAGSSCSHGSAVCLDMFLGPPGPPLLPSHPGCTHSSLKVLQGWFQPTWQHHCFVFLRFAGGFGLCPPGFLCASLSAPGSLGSALWGSPGFIWAFLFSLGLSASLEISQDLPGGLVFLFPQFL